MEVYVIGQSLDGWDVDVCMELESRIVSWACGITAYLFDEVPDVDVGEVVRVRHGEGQEVRLG
jgi:hypothetical protein